MKIKVNGKNEGSGMTRWDALCAILLLSACAAGFSASG
jgi:hypothetical protein